MITSHSDYTEHIHKPVGPHTRREQSGVSCQAAGCEACIPSHKAGSPTSLESQKSQADCNLPGNLENILTHVVIRLACSKTIRDCESTPSGTWPKTKGLQNYTHYRMNCI